MHYLSQNLLPTNECNSAPEDKNNIVEKNQEDELFEESINDAVPDSSDQATRQISDEETNRSTFPKKVIAIADLPKPGQRINCKLLDGSDELKDLKVISRAGKATGTNGRTIVVASFDGAGKEE